MRKIILLVASLLAGISPIRSEVTLDGLLRQIANGSEYAAYGDCGNLSSMAVATLMRYGYSARRVSVLTLDTWNDVDNGHTLTEVYNPVYGTWMTVDFSTDRLYAQTIQEFVRYRGKFISLSNHPFASTFVDELGIFANIERWYDRVGQVALIENSGLWWHGDTDNRSRIDSYSPSYRYTQDFIRRFYAAQY